MCPKTTCEDMQETNKNKLTTQQVQPSLTIVVVHPCEVDKLFAASFANRRREQHHRETICACDQPMQKNTIDRVYTDLNRDDSLLSETPEHSTVV